MSERGTSQTRSGRSRSRSTSRTRQPQSRSRSGARANSNSNSNSDSESNSNTNTNSPVDPNSRYANQVKRAITSWFRNSGEQTGKSTHTANNTRSTKSYQDCIELLQGPNFENLLSKDVFQAKERSNAPDSITNQLRSARSQLVFNDQIREYLDEIANAVRQRNAGDADTQNVADLLQNIRLAGDAEQQGAGGPAQQGEEESEGESQDEQFEVIGRRTKAAPRAPTPTPPSSEDEEEEEEQGTPARRRTTTPRAKKGAATPRAKRAAGPSAKKAGTTTSAKKAPGPKRAAGPTTRQQQQQENEESGDEEFQTQSSRDVELGGRSPSYRNNANRNTATGIRIPVPVGNQNRNQPPNPNANTNANPNSNSNPTQRQPNETAAETQRRNRERLRQPQQGPVPRSPRLSINRPGGEEQVRQFLARERELQRRYGNQNRNNTQLPGAEGEQERDLSDNRRLPASEFVGEITHWRTVGAQEATRGLNDRGFVSDHVPPVVRFGNALDNNVQNIHADFETARKDSSFARVIRVTNIVQGIVDQINRSAERSNDPRGFRRMAVEATEERFGRGSGEALLVAGKISAEGYVLRVLFDKMIKSLSPHVNAKGFIKGCWDYSSSVCGDAIRANVSRALDNIRDQGRALTADAANDLILNAIDAGLEECDTINQNRDQGSLRDFYSNVNWRGSAGNDA